MNTKNDYQHTSLESTGESKPNDNTKETILAGAHKVRATSAQSSPIEEEGITEEPPEEEEPKVIQVYYQSQYLISIRFFAVIFV